MLWYSTQVHLGFQFLQHLCLVISLTCLCKNWHVIFNGFIGNSVFSYKLHCKIPQNSCIHSINLKVCLATSDHRTPLNGMWLEGVNKQTCGQLAHSMHRAFCLLAPVRSSFHSSNSVISVLLLLYQGFLNPFRSLS